MTLASCSRIFRYSVLNLLSATLIVAVFVAWNMIGKAEVISSGPVVVFGLGMCELDGLRYRAGWPVCYQEIYRYVPLQSGAAEIDSGWPHKQRANFVGVNLLALCVNILVAVGAALAGPALVGPALVGKALRQ